LLLTKTDLTPPPPGLIARLEVLNPAARLVDAQEVLAAEVLFGTGDEDGEPVVRARASRFTATAIHAHGIAAFVVTLREPMTRLQFAMALGGLARERGEDLLRVKGLVAFADRDGGPAAIHAVQHTMYPPRWLNAWPDADRTSRLVFIVRGIEASTILTHFAAGAPVMNDS
jgi:G3E family GTPase